MTYHKTDNLLHCHHCEAMEQIDSFCEHCKSENIACTGAGTQKIEHVLGMPDQKLNQIREDAMARDNKEFNLEKQSQEFHSFFN